MRGELLWKEKLRYEPVARQIRLPGLGDLYAAETRTRSP